VAGLELLLVNDNVAQLDQMNFLGLLCLVRGGQTERATIAPNPLMGYWNELEIYRCGDGCQRLALAIARQGRPGWASAAPAPGSAAARRPAATAKTPWPRLCPARPALASRLCGAFVTADAPPADAEPVQPGCPGVGQASRRGDP